jgi:hypothetical protein
MRKISEYLTVLLASALASLSTSASAHHSFAMFDLTAIRTVDGAITKFEDTSPHSWIWITSKDGKAWGFESEGPASLARWGIKKSVLKVGDAVSITCHPIRDGSNIGSFVSVKAADGIIYALGKPPRPASEPSVAAK